MAPDTAHKRTVSSKVPDILICASEYLQMPVRRSDEEPLQKLMSELRGDLDLKARALLATISDAIYHASLMRIALCRIPSSSSFTRQQRRR